MRKALSNFLVDELELRNLFTSLKLHWKLPGGIMNRGPMYLTYEKVVKIKRDPKCTNVLKALSTIQSYEF